MPLLTKIFLPFSVLDVPYIGKGSSRGISPQSMVGPHVLGEEPGLVDGPGARELTQRLKFFLTFSRLDVPWQVEGTRRTFYHEETHYSFL